MNKEDRNQKPSFKLTTDTLLLIERLRELDYSGRVSYRQLSELIGRNVQNDASGLLATAINYLEREEQMFFSKVRAEGVQRITESDRVKEAPLRARKRIRSSIRTMRRDLERVPAEKLNREEQRERNANLALSDTLAWLAKEKEAKKVIEAAPEDGILATGKIIDLLRKKAG